MFYIMQSTKDEYTKNLYHIHAIRVRPYKTLIAARKAIAGIKGAFIQTASRVIYN